MNYQFQADFSQEIVTKESLFCYVHILTFSKNRKIVLPERMKEQKNVLNHGVDNNMISRPTYFHFLYFHPLANTIFIPFYPSKYKISS